MYNTILELCTVFLIYSTLLLFDTGDCYPYSSGLLYCYFNVTGAIIWLFQCQWSNPEGYGLIYPMNLHHDGNDDKWLLVPRSNTSQNSQTAKMVHITKEIMMFLRASLAVMWFPVWYCLFNMHFSVQCTRCRWPEGIQSEKSSFAIMCCLPYQKVQFRYNY